MTDELSRLQSETEAALAAAADLQFAMQDITSRFEKQTGKKVHVVYGSSGNFAQQLRSAVPVKDQPEYDF